MNDLPQPQQSWPVSDPHLQIEEEREHMFEKSLTPSDVGKLNRLVIPKQHAENYFPLAGDKGSVLSFEDESGKEWRFRYSYWTSSQSYVLTKGWSRYVKEKLLDAGDVVVFQRGHQDHLFYIGFRRRGDSLDTLAPSHVAAVPNALLPSSQFYSTTSSSPPDLPINLSVEQGVNDSTAATGPSNFKRVKLFGVNLV